MTQGPPGAPALSSIPTGTWTTKASQLEARNQCGAAALNGLLYVFGGNSDSAPAIATPEVYDPVTDSWILGAPDSILRTSMSVQAINNRIFVAEGWIDSNSATPTNALGIYDPATTTWATAVFLRLVGVSQRPPSSMVSYISRVASRARQQHAGDLRSGD